MLLITSKVFNIFIYLYNLLVPGPGAYKVYSEFGDPSDYKPYRAHTEANTSTIKEEKHEKNEDSNMKTTAN